MMNLITKRFFSTLKVPIEAIKKLRQQTSAPMGECKKALEESLCNHEDAVKWLKKKGLTTAQKRSEKQTKQGVIASFLTPCRRKAVLLQVNCETDFVAKNDLFLKFVNAVGNRFLEKEETVSIEGASPEEVKNRIAPLLEETLPGNIFAEEEQLKNMGEQLKLVSSRLQENIRISRAVSFNSDNCRYGTYVHRQYVGSVGLQACVVQVSVDPQPAEEAEEEVNEFMDDLACQILGMPPKYLSFEEIPAEVIDEETEKVKQELTTVLSKAPEHTHQKIISGKLMSNFYSQSLLGCMPYLLSNEGKPVSDVWNEVEQSTGSNISVIKSLTWQVK